MRKDLTLLLFVVAVSAIFSSCEKIIDNVLYPSQPIDSSTKVHFSFKSGTYWVYRDSVSGRLDTLFVTNVETSTASTSDDNLYDNMRITVQPSNTIVPGISQLTITLTANLSYEYILQSAYNKTFYTNVAANYPFAVGGFITQTSLSLNLNNHLYTNVAEGHSATDTTKSSTMSDDWFYINDSVGMIKMRFNHPLESFYQVLELQQCHLVK